MTTMNNPGPIIRNFNRFELKYLVTLKQAEQVKSALRLYLVPDEHGRDNGKYSLTSLYFDSPNLRCYHEKVDGIRFRRKLRIRRYETGEMLTDETPVFLEIKQRVDRVTQKRRVVLPYGETLRLCNDRQLPEGAPPDRAILEEMFVFLWQYNLRPVSIVRYDRQAFMGTKYDPGLRVTFDTSLSFQSHPLHLHTTPNSLPVLPISQVIMEIKVNDRIPNWLTELIAAHNLQLIRISKYCRSIEAAERMPHAGWGNAPIERSNEVLATSAGVFLPAEPREVVRRA